MLDPQPQLQDDLENREMPIEIIVLSAQSETATIKAQIHGLTSASGPGSPQLLQLWGQRGGEWYFVIPDRQRKM